jgi:hypothetical protein
MTEPWRSLGVFQPATITDRFALWLGLNHFIEAQGIQWHPFKADVHIDLRYQVPEPNLPNSFTPGNVGWHPDGNCDWLVTWASRDPTLIRWFDDSDGDEFVETPDPYEVALIDNRRAEHCAPQSIGGPRWFFRAFVEVPA